MNTTANIFEQPITECPDIPARFGEDGGKFHYYYDQLADELDEDLTKRLKSQLDSLLIFAGLFAGVNSAFLALTLPMMSADPVDDTNALLLQLVKGGNATVNSEADLPSATFSPPSAIYPVNILFAVSLTCALMSSFLAVLGQQWLVYYRKRSGGGAAHQRKEQLRRQLGAQRWQLELVLDDILPGLLQVGLVIFCISFILYLRTLSGSMSSVVAAIVGSALAITVGVAVCATWDRMCPYQSPLSHLFCWSMDRLKPVPVAFVWLFIFLKAYLYEFWGTRSRAERHTDAGESSSPNESTLQSEESQKNSWNLAQEITSRGLTRVVRKEETDDDLIVASVKRVILTSEHPTALIHAATNICAIDNEESLKRLLNDAEFSARLYDLFSTFSESRGSLPTQLQAMPTAATKAFATAILHLALSVGTIMDLIPPKDRVPAIENFPQGQPVLSDDLVRNLYYFTNDVMLEENLWDRDLEDVNHLPLLGILLLALFYDSFYAYAGKWYLEDVTRRLMKFTTSHQLLCTLTCAVKMHVASLKSDSLEGATKRYEQLPGLFEFAKTTYSGRKHSYAVPFLSEALKLSIESRDGENRDRSEVYRICFGVLRHACELEYIDLTGVFAASGLLMRGIELDIRHPGIPKPYQEALQECKDQYVRILVPKLLNGRFLPVYTNELCESLAETLRCILEFARAQDITSDAPSLPVPISCLQGIVRNKRPGRLTRL
ncbi:hypothetical protein M407DRAFT_20456 [Tulasnella calospora MUT 4182]|uniref:DUF6535 domain-containing protein n=1 Tax=Tulasnella calospora MUT 4182 TaxID=1051891 RepID=A0A0C3QPV1_9AGAM|nr:hypothetical protein M407DRAFT_20456 [Tulasnella calospora MUT 4182]